MSTEDPPPQTAAEALENAMSFAKRGFMYWKRAFLIFIIASLATIPGVFMKPRIYKSETVVLYQDNIRSESIGTGENTNDARRVGARLREMLYSRASLEPIVNDTPRYATIADHRGLQDAVEELRLKISFKAREGDTFEIGYEAPDPAEAQEVTRRLGEGIIKEAQVQRNEQSKATKDYLEAQSKANKVKLDEANGQMSAFLTLHPEYVRFTLPGMSGAGGPLPPGGVGAIPTAPPGTKDPVLFAMEAEYRQISAQLAAGPGKGHEESEETKAARKDLAETKSRVTDQHPDMIAAKRRLQAAQDADAKRAATGASGLSPTERDALLARQAVLKRSIAAHRSGDTRAVAPLTSAPTGPTSVSLEVEFRRLQRETENLKEAQKLLDDKLFKAGLTEGASTSNRNIQVKILDPAFLPVHPSGKPRSALFAMYMAGALIAAIFAALVSARLDDRIYARTDLDSLRICSVVGVIPRSRA